MIKKTLKNKSLKLRINSDKFSNNKLNAISKELNQRIDKIEAVSEKLNQQINKLNNVLEQLKQRIDERIDERSVSNNVIVGGEKDIKDMNDFSKYGHFLSWTEDKIADIKNMRYEIYKKIKNHKKYEEIKKRGDNVKRPIDNDFPSFNNVQDVIDEIDELMTYYKHIDKFTIKYGIITSGSNSGGGDHEKDFDRNQYENVAIRLINILEKNYTVLYNEL